MGRGGAGAAALFPRERHRGQPGCWVTVRTPEAMHICASRGGLVPAGARWPACSPGDSASLTFTRENKNRVPLQCQLHPGCWGASTDRAAGSALKRLQKQGHCEHQGGVEKHHGFLEDHESLKSKRSRERETKGKEKKGEEKKQKALPSSKGPPRAKVSSHRGYQTAAAAAEQSTGHCRGGRDAAAPRAAPCPGARLPAWHPSTRRATSSTLALGFVPESETGRPQGRGNGDGGAAGLEKVPGKDPACSPQPCCPQGGAWGHVTIQRSTIPCRVQVRDAGAIPGRRWVPLCSQTRPATCYPLPVPIPATTCPRGSRAGTPVGTRPQGFTQS